MKNYYCHILTIVTIVVALTSGCGKKDTGFSDAPLIRVRDTIVTVSDFRQIIKDVHLDLSDEQPADSADGAMWQRLLNQTVEELIIKERAKELSLNISEAELEAAIGKIKEDYPDDTFQEVFLENAVSFSVWQRQYRERLLLEKVIATELYEKVEITPEEIAAYYGAHYQNSGEASSEADEKNNINEMIVNQIKRDKAETDYPAWIAELHDRYQVEIDRDKWQQMVETDLKSE
ncbi:MAG: hypothetical protein HKM93_03975 [Desulfobacteraceae bacterium]|nr:hypothetical protein [Desulfobacteraceae bacterium]